MIKSIGKVTLAGLLAAIVLGVPVSLSAQDKPAVPSAPAAPTPPKPKAKGLPFVGKIGAVDKSTKTITLSDKNKRTFQVTSETKIMKGGKPATLDDAMVGDEIAGQYTEGADGKLNARSVRLGPKPKAPDAPTPPAVPAAPAPK